VSPGFAVAAATRAQLPDILAIYNEVIRNTTAVYSDVEGTLEDREKWFDAKRAQGFPVLIAAGSDGVLGFGTFGEFRAWPCYRHSVEHSVHVRTGCRGRGVGRAIVTALIDAAAAMQKHVMIAGIDAENVISISLHESLGFEIVGRFHQVGHKFGRWLDLKFMQRFI
jgi:L-amino acid N-acyltransferase YncA